MEKLLIIVAIFAASVFSLADSQLPDSQADKGGRAIDRPPTPTVIIPKDTQEQNTFEPDLTQTLEGQQLPNGGVCPCEQLYLYSTAALADKQGATVGKYIRGAQQHNGRSYYWKTFRDKTFFLQYQSNDWMISDSLSSKSFNVVLRRSEELCPLGIKGGYDKNQTYDQTLTIECLDNQATHNCCTTLTIDAKRKIKDIQGARMGTYEKVGEFNNHPLYFLSQFGYKNYLYFKMDGLERDGWTIGEDPADLSFAITTRQRTSCPNQVSMGYERDLDVDLTFTIVCKEEE